MNWLGLNSESIGEPNQPMEAHSGSSFANGFGPYGFAVPAGNGVLTGSYHICGVNYGLLDYVRSSNTLTLGSFQPVIGGCTSVAPALSPNKTSLVYYNEQTREIMRFGVALDGTLVVQARTTLEPDVTVRRLALTDTGEVLVEIYYEESVVVRVYNEQLAYYGQPYTSEGRQLSIISGLHLSGDGKTGLFVEVDQSGTTSSIMTFPAAP